MSKVTKFIKPRCPYCGRGEIHEYDTCILDGSGSEIIVEGKVKEIGISSSDKELEKVGYYDAIYQGGHPCVGIRVDYSKDPNSKLSAEIEEVEYKCTECGVIFSNPYSLADALSDADKEDQYSEYD